MKRLIDYIEKEEKRSETNKVLVSELKKISEDVEFIYGVLLYAEHDEDRKALLEYIKKGEDVKPKRVEPNVPKNLVFPHIAALFILLYDSIISLKKHHTARKNKPFWCEAVF